MNGPIAWLDGLLAIVIFTLGLTILAYVFRHEDKDESQSEA
ncbi:hypothetical protein [Caldalkalibacillus salinus]|nr:hypothetical protein [Caldalkalibacillus salinus]